MTQFDVDTAALDLIRQLAERQSTHLAAIRDYLDDHATLDDVGGLVMACLGSQYHAGRDNARTGLDQGVTICDAVGTNADSTRQAYLDADRAAHGLFAALAAELGIALPAYGDPATSTLGSSGAQWTAAGWSVDAPIPAIGSLPPDVNGLLSVPDKLISGATDRLSGIETSSPWSFGGWVNDQLKSAEKNAWDAADQRWGIPTATSSLQERYDQAQYARYGAGYDAGTNTSDMGWMTSDSDWARDQMLDRTVNAAGSVTSTLSDLKGAWNAVEHLEETSNRNDAVRGVASDQSNTSAYDWAR